MAPETIEQMREWLMELEWGDMEPEDFAAVPPQQIERAVDKYFAGGVEEFLRTMTPVNDTISGYTAPEPPHVGDTATGDELTCWRDISKNKDPQPPSADDALNTQTTDDKKLGFASRTINWFPGK